MNRTDANRLYDRIELMPEGQRRADMAALALGDLYYLLTRVMRRRDMDRDWLYERCREVEAAPDGRIDLWARDHYKSTIITVGKTIQDVLRNPEITVGIFSHTRPIAKSFLRQIKRELESNETLKSLFPGVLYPAPWRESPSWSDDAGLILKRQANPKEATIEAWGLVDGQPIGKHFSLMIYDDVVTRKSVNTPEQIAKTTEAWELSLSLAADGATLRYVGTRYHLHDTYSVILARGGAAPRIHPATSDGTDTGDPVLLSRETLEAKRRQMGPYTYSCQMLLDPVADKSQGFRLEWVRYWEPAREAWEVMNRVILVDPAGSKKRGSDYTVMCVVGWHSDGRRYLIHGVRDRLSLTGRAAALFALVRKYKPLFVAYEAYGLQADIEHIQTEMTRQTYHFDIVKVGGAVSKQDRIRRLIPLFEQGRLLLPAAAPFCNDEGQWQDFTRLFLDEEYEAFPLCRHDDMLDCLARCCEPDIGVDYPDEMPAVQPLPNERWRPGGGFADGYDPDSFGRRYEPLQ